MAGSAGGANGAAANGAANGAAAAKPAVEVEVKLRLPDAAAHAALARALAPCFRGAAEQENFFFDGARGQLAAARSVLRLRLYGGARRAVLTCKGRQVLADGVGTAAEEEEELPDAAAARGFVADPAGLLALAAGEPPASPLMAAVAARHGLLAPGAGGLVALGGFANLRRDFAWRGLALELDQTTFPWGTLHELECETDRPAEAKAELEALLRSLNIEYSYAAKSKYANFVDKTLV